MSRIAISCLITFASLGSMIHAQIHPSPRPVNLVPDESYVPSVGDALQVYRREAGTLIAAVAASELEKFQIWAKANEAKDDFVLKEMEKQKEIVSVDPGTKVRILEIQTRGIDVRRQRGTGQLISAYDNPVWRYYTVRVLEGPLKDKQLLIDKEWVKRCREVAVKPSPKSKTLTKTVSPLNRAATLLKSAQNLEAEGKYGPALDYYRQVLKDYSDSSEAKAAEKRVKALDPSGK